MSYGASVKMASYACQTAVTGCLVCYFRVRVVSSVIRIGDEVRVGVRPRDVYFDIGYLTGSVRVSCVVFGVKRAEM